VAFERWSKTNNIFVFDAFLFLQGKKCNANQKKICAVYGEDDVSERVCQNWFAKFHAGDTTCEDRERSGKFLVVDDDQIKSLIESNPYYTTHRRDNQRITKDRCKPFTYLVTYLGTIFGYPTIYAVKI